VLSFAARFEEFADTLMFNVVGNLVPLAFASVVLWHYDPLLVAARKARSSSSRRCGG
jgi:ATP-binding cassette subfamily B protein